MEKNTIKDSRIKKINKYPDEAIIEKKSKMKKRKEN